MTRILLTLMLLFLAGNPSMSWASAPGPQAPIKSALFNGGRLWLLDEQGHLSSLAEADEQPRAEIAAGNVAGLCVSAGQVTVITNAKAKSQHWEIRQFTGQEWKMVEPLGIDDLTISAFGCDETRIVAIAGYMRDRFAFVLVKDDKTITTSLNGSLHFGEANTYIGGDFLYVGMNGGEWGGGLQRVSLTTGLVDSIDSLSSMDACDGPLFYGCDPVNAITALPGRPGCVAAAVGIGHIGWNRGRIVSVCDHKVETLYDRVVSTDAPLTDGGRALTQMARFESLIAVGANLIASGPDGLYQIEAQTGSGRPLRMPAFRRYGLFTVSFAMPEIVVIESDVDTDNAVWEYARPILVKR